MYVYVAHMNQGCVCVNVCMCTCECVFVQRLLALIMDLGPSNFPEANDVTLFVGYILTGSIYG